MDVVNESISTRESPSSLPVESSENVLQATQSTCTTNGRRTPSAVWGHFDKLVVNDELKAKCRHCDKLLSRGSKSGTSHLRDHLTVRCSKKNKKVDIRQKMLGINRRMDGSSTLENTNFNQESSRKELANMVIVHEYPLAIVDHIGFRRFVHSLNPNFKFMSRNTLKADIMKSFASEKATLKKVLENSKSRIAITTDMWTATNQRRGYMVVTAHYIDQLWQLRNKIIRFAYVPCPHTKVTLAQVLLDTLNVYNIAEKISSIVVDNCSTNDAMMEIMKLRLGESLMLEGRFLHMRCTAHILNLIVQDGLDVIGGGIEKVRDCVAFWVATPKRIELFEDKVKSMKGEEARKLPLDCKTRWNSTFLMLEGVLPYKDVFGNLKRQYHRLKFTSPSQEEWELAALVCDKLKSFHKLTELFSGRKFPTSNLFFRQVCEIKLDLTSWMQSDIEIIRDMAKKMVEKFDKYWMTINEVLAIAAILDPRNKLECVEFYFNEIYGDRADVEIMRVQNTLCDLLSEYEDLGLSRDSHLASNSTQVNVDGVGGDDKWSRVKKTKRRKLNVKSELDHYLEEDALPESENFDILDYWKIELKYPTLQKIAKDILAVPASSVASESAFSMGGRVISPHRSKLASSTVEALVCMQNWILGEYFSGTSLDTIESCATILEDRDIMDHDSVGNNVDSQIIDLDSGDDDEMDFM